jgi:hypothetical protein
VLVGVYRRLKQIWVELQGDKTALQTDADADADGSGDDQPVFGGRGTVAAAYDLL